jgi:hypothetical protein
LYNKKESAICRAAWVNMAHHLKKYLHGFVEALKNLAKYRFKNDFLDQQNNYVRHSSTMSKVQKVLTL